MIRCDIKTETLIKSIVLKSMVIDETIDRSLQDFLEINGYLVKVFVLKDHKEGHKIEICFMTKATLKRDKKAIFDLFAEFFSDKWVTDNYKLS